MSYGGGVWESAIETHGLTKRYRRTAAVRDLSITFAVVERRSP